MTPPSDRSWAHFGQQACSPLLARHLATMRGPVLVVESAAPNLIGALVEAGLEVVIATAEDGRAGELAQQFRGQSAVAVVHAGPSQLPAGFASVIALGLTLTEAVAMDVVRLLAPGGQLALTATNVLGPSGTAPTAIGRSALSALLTGAGLAVQDWALLFPDPWSTTLMVGSQAMDPAVGIDLEPLLDMKAGPPSAAGPRWSDALREGALADLAPGFLVVASSAVDPSQPATALVRFAGEGRRQRFRSSTRMERDGDRVMVRRDRLYPALPASSGPLTQVLEDEPYLPGRPWSVALGQLLATPGWTVEDVAQWLGRWLRELTSAAGGDDRVDGRFLDAIPRNLMVDGASGTFIDLEWVWHEAIPRQVVVFRAILHSLGAVQSPAAADPGVPASLREAILQIADRAGEPFAPGALDECWAFESILQEIATGSRPPSGHLDHAPSVPATAAGRPAGPDPADALRVQLAGMGAESDGLRADVDMILGHLDDARSDRDALAQERDALAQERGARLSDIEQLTALAHDLRAELAAVSQDLAEITAAFGALGAAHQQEATELRLDRDRLGAAAAAHRQRRAEAARVAYRAELADRAQALQDKRAHQDLLSALELARAGEAALAGEARRADQLEEEMRATYATVSWRLTRPLRSARGAQRRVSAVIARLRPGRGQIAAAAQADVHPLLPSGDPSLPPPASAEAPLVDLAFYRRRYPDLDNLDITELLAHYGYAGQSEGRHGLSWLRSSLVLPPPEPDDRERVLLLIDDTSVAGAPALSAKVIDQLAKRYHVVSILMGAGPWTEAVAQGSGTTVVLGSSRDPAPEEMRILADELRQLGDPLFAVAVSRDGDALAAALEATGVPMVRLVREDLLDAAADALALARYVEAIDALGQRAARRQQDLGTILAFGDFDPGHFAGRRADQDSEQLARSYLSQIESAAPLRQPRTGLVVQRPRPGFHPLAYAESAPDFLDDGRDPFAHYLRAGRPAGRWAKRLIVPEPDVAEGPVLAHPSVLVHGHFHYSQDLPDFLDLLATIRTPLSLALTTTTHQVGLEIERIVQVHPADRQAEVLLVPNRGRNLSALLSGPVADRLSDHEVVLHVHGKRSPHLDPGSGRRWRDYLWAHLIGSQHRLADQVIAEFARSARLGLVAPEDRHLHDWDLNLDRARELLPRLGRTMHLPVHFDFAMGAMFWARTSALRPLLDARLGEADYPAEPVPHDGTALHALERLLALMIEDDGFEFAKTYVPDVWR